jgi:hypothetical protein
MKRDKIKLKVTDARVTGDWQDRDSGDLGIEYFVEVEYKYDETKDPTKFVLTFNGNKISFKSGSEEDHGDRLTQPYSERWFENINWTDINVDLHTFDGDEIRFVAFEKAPDKIKTIFIKEYVQDYISTETNQSIMK